MDRLAQLAHACAAEQQRVELLRIFAWSTADQRERICRGLTLQPLTFRRWLELKGQGNAYATGEQEPTREDALKYLWTASTRYRLRGPRARWRAWRFRRSRIHRVSTEVLHALVAEHLEAQFMEQPYGGGSADTGLPAVEPIISYVYALVRIARVSPEAALDYTLPRGFALIRAHERGTDPEYSAPIPARLDHIQNQYGRTLQKQYADILGGPNHGQ